MKRWGLLVSIVLLLATTVALADIVIRTKDGRTFKVPVQAGEVASIEFVVAASTPPAPPPPPTPPTTPPAPSFGSTLTSGRAISGEAWNAAGRRWPFEIKITSYDKATGAIAGEIRWLSLSSVHRIRGKLTAAKLTFTETEAIQAGGAHLNVSYDMAVSGGSATGTWLDNGDKSTGGVKIPVP